MAEYRPKDVSAVAGIGLSPRRKDLPDTPLPAWPGAARRRPNGGGTLEEEAVAHAG